jgi:hypothetical protein
MGEDSLLRYGSVAQPKDLRVVEKQSGKRSYHAAAFVSALNATAS